MAVVTVPVVTVPVVLPVPLIGRHGRRRRQRRDADGERDRRRDAGERDDGEKCDGAAATDRQVRVHDTGSLEGMAGDRSSTGTRPAADADGQPEEPAVRSGGGTSATAPAASAVRQLLFEQMNSA